MTDSTESNAFERYRYKPTTLYWTIMATIAIVLGAPVLLVPHLGIVVRLVLLAFVGGGLALYKVSVYRAGTELEPTNLHRLIQVGATDLDDKYLDRIKTLFGAEINDEDRTRVVFAGRLRHRIFLYGPVAATIVIDFMVVIIGVALLYAPADTGQITIDSGATASLFILIAVALGVIVITIQWVRWSSEYLVLTKSVIIRALIYPPEFPWFKNIAPRVILNKAEFGNISQGYLGKLFGYETLSIGVPGKEENKFFEHMNGIPSAYDVQKMLSIGQ